MVVVVVAVVAGAMTVERGMKLAGYDALSETI